jgi:hypothetical protein
MSAVHDEIVITYACATPAASGPDMNRDVFPDLGPSTDLEARRFAAEGAILGLGAETGIREDSTIRPDPGSAHDRGMRLDFDTGPEFHFATNEDERPDHRIRGQDCTIFHKRGRVDVRQRFSSSC